MGKADSVKQGAVKLKSGVTSHMSTFFIGVLFIAVIIMLITLGAFTFNVEALIPVATTLVGIPIIGSWFMGFVAEGSLWGINWYTVSYMVIAALGVWYLSKRYYVGKATQLVTVEPTPTTTSPTVTAAEATAKQQAATVAKQQSALEALEAKQKKLTAELAALKEGKTESA